MISKIRRTSDNRITELEAYVAVTGQDILQADNLTTVQKEGKKMHTYFYFRKLYIW